MSRKALLLTLGAAIAAAALLVWAFRPAPVQVETAAVVRGPFVRTIEEDGTTRVRERYQITAPVAGTLLRMAVDEGDPVLPEQVVATILPSAPQLLDPRTRAELVARRDAAEARVARARTLVRQADAALKQAELDARRLAELATQGFVSRTQREQADLALDIRRRDAEAARFEADAALHDLDQARAALGRSRGGTAEDAAAAWEVRSPVAGAVLSVAQDSGGPVALGAPILDVGDVGRLEAVIDVLTSDATQISPQAYVALTAGEGVRLAGRVRAIEPAAVTKVSALGIEEQRVNVIVDLLPNPTRAGLIGHAYHVDAQIEIERIDDAVQVPVAALFRSGESWAVFTVEDGRTRLRPVQIGARTDAAAVVTRGLSPGERVVVYPSDALRDGSSIVHVRDS